MEARRAGRQRRPLADHPATKAPSTIAIDVGVAPTGTGAPEGDRSQGVNGYVLNTMTPCTERTSLYFWAFCRNYALGDQRITTLLREGVSGVFAEDETILEAQQLASTSTPTSASTTSTSTAARCGRAG